MTYPPKSSQRPCKIYTEISPRFSPRSMKSRQDWWDLAEIAEISPRSRYDVCWILNLGEISSISPRLLRTHQDCRDRTEIVEISTHVHVYMYMLQVKSNLKSICSNLGLGQFVLTRVNLFQPRSIWFFLFLRQTKKYFRSSLHPPSSLYLHSTYLTYYSLPALPTSQPLFFLSQCLPCEPWTTDLFF